MYINEHVVYGDRSGSIADAAIGFVRRATQDALRRHVYQAAGVGLVSIVGAIATWLFIAYGPALQPPASMLAVFVLVCFALLAVIALMAALGPLGSVLAQEGLRTLDATVRRDEAEEELALLEGRVALACRILSEPTAKYGGKGELPRRLNAARRLLGGQFAAAADAPEAVHIEIVEAEIGAVVDRLEKEDPALASELRALGALNAASDRAA